MSFCLMGCIIDVAAIQCARVAFLFDVSASFSVSKHKKPTTKEKIGPFRCLWLKNAQNAGAVFAPALPFSLSVLDPIVTVTP